MLGKKPFGLLREYIESRTSSEFWNLTFRHKGNLVKLIIDCGQLEQLHNIATDSDFIHTVEGLTRNLCFDLHTARLMKLKEG